MSLRQVKLNTTLSIIAILLVGCNLGITDTPVNPTPEVSQTVQVMVATIVQQTLAAKPTLTPMPLLTSTTAAPATSILTATPSLTLPPTASSTLTPTATSSLITAHIDQNTYCRIGPGLVFSVVFIAIKGEDLQVVSATTLNNYVVVENPKTPGQTCWLLTQYVTIHGNLSGLPVVTPPPTPTPKATSTPTLTPTPTITPTVTNTP